MNAYKLFALPAVALFLLALMPLGAAQADVTVTSADPSSAPQGTISLDVTVTGSEFDSSATVSFLVTGTTNPGGITVKKVVVRGSKKLIATIDVADTAVVTNFDIQVALSGGRKGKGTSLFAVLAKTNDPCAALNLDFPAFIYWRPSPQGVEVVVADSTAQCSRSVLELAGSLKVNPYSGAFSYPIAGTTDIGRVIWSQGNASVYGVTFQVTGTSIAVSPKELIYEDLVFGIVGLDLSKDGATAYASMVGDNDSVAPRIVAINIGDGSASNAFVGPADGSSVSTFAVNEGGTLFLFRSDASGVASELLRIEPSCTDLSCATVLGTSPNGAHGPNYIAASPVGNRLVYSEVPSGFISCWLLQIIPDTGGAILNSGQPRYGTGLTWYGDKILANGIKPPTRRGNCDYTGMITQIDPATSAETVLVKGNDPDGR